MTEKEAIERLKYDLAMLTFNPITGEETPLWLLPEDAQDSYNAYECAIKALEEIQQYRAIGTVEKCREAVEKLARYEDLEQDGRLLELPCKVGDTVYRIVDDCDYPSDCHTKRMCKKCEYRNISIEEETVSLEDIIRLRDEFGETIFFSEEAAEAALKERSRQ